MWAVVARRKQEGKGHAPVSEVEGGGLPFLHREVLDPPHLIFKGKGKEIGVDRATRRGLVAITIRISRRTHAHRCVAALSQPLVLAEEEAGYKSRDGVPEQCVVSTME